MQDLVLSESQMMMPLDLNETNIEAKTTSLESIKAYQNEQVM